MAQSNLQFSTRVMAMIFALFSGSVASANEEATWETRQSVSTGSQTYLVAVAPDKTYALVGPSSSSTKMTVNTVKRAARTATGCRASVEAVISMWTGGNDNDEIPMSSIKGRKAVRANLKC